MSKEIPYINPSLVPYEEVYNSKYYLDLIVTGKEVTKRWGNLRDAFTKSKRKLKESKKSGAGAAKIKKYVYADQMQFLNKLIQSREVVESLEDRTDDNENKDVYNPLEAPLPRKETICENPNPKPQEYKRRRRPDEVELKMMKALEEPAPSPHISFIQGLLPHLNKFGDSEILEFQMGVLEVISKINNKRQNTAQPRPQVFPPQTPSYYPNNNYSFPEYQQFPPSQSYSNQFSAINSFQPQQPQTHQYPNPQTYQFKNPQNANNIDSNHQQACSSKAHTLERQQEQTTAQYYQDFGHISAATSPETETCPSASPSPGGSVYSDTTYDFT
ncbi:uncharacterized protein LOC116163088 [Photinus pyralis]|uniref:uncharacterized protein LOC116159534 n=1 Tax=Photinus pyralis TaxID=7054 RepID=UPI00126703E5|nr:uncharacterized protein LOC116159534 [Photinus pyralis]XP_031332793.1 uncharacterized protein LOC116163088 [Photinus pyralis]